MATPRKRKHGDPLHLSSSHGKDPTATWKPNLRPHHKSYSFSQRTTKSTSVAAAAHGKPSAPAAASTASYASGNPGSKGLRRFQRPRIAHKSTPVTAGIDLEPTKSRLHDPRKKCNDNDGNRKEAKDPRVVASGKAHGEEGLVPRSVACEAPTKRGNPAPPPSGNSELPTSSQATSLPRADSQRQKPTVAPKDTASKPPHRRAHHGGKRSDTSHGNPNRAIPPANKTTTLAITHPGTAAKRPIQTRTGTPAVRRKEATSVGMPSGTDLPRPATTSKTVLQPRTEDPGRGQRTLPSRKNLDRAQNDKEYGRNYRCPLPKEASLEAPDKDKPFHPAKAAASSSSSSSSSLTRANLLALSQQANGHEVSLVVPLTSLCRSETQATTDVMGLSPEAAFLRRATDVDEESGALESHHPHPRSTLAVPRTAPTLVRKKKPPSTHRGIAHSHSSYWGPPSPASTEKESESEKDSASSYGHPSKRTKRHESSCQTQTPTRLLDKFNHVRTPEKPTKAAARAKEFQVGTSHHYYSYYSEDETSVIHDSGKDRDASAKDSPIVDRRAARRDAIPKFIYSGQQAPHKPRNPSRMESSTPATHSSHREPPTKKKEPFRPSKKRRSTDGTTRGTGAGKKIHAKASKKRDRNSPLPHTRTKRGLDSAKDDGEDLRRKPITQETARRRISLESPPTRAKTIEPAYTRRTRPKPTKPGRKQAQTHENGRRVSLESPPTASKKRSVGHGNRGGSYQPPSKLASSGESDEDSSDWSACWDNLSIGSKLRARYLSEPHSSTSSSEQSRHGTGDFRHDASAEEPETAPKMSLRNAYRKPKACHTSNSRTKSARSKETKNPRHRNNSSMIRSNSLPASSERHSTCVSVKTISIWSSRSIRWILFLLWAYALLWAGHQASHHHRSARTSRGAPFGCGATNNPHRIPPRIWFSENPSVSLVELSMIHEATIS